MSDRWDETWRRLRSWTSGQGPAERLAAQVLQAEGYHTIDPIHPLGGPDGQKDALIKTGSEVWIMAVYFPRERVSFAQLKKKFLTDYQGVAANKVSGMAFVTNQSVTLSQRRVLLGKTVGNVALYHLDRIVHVLDQPSMHGIRKQYLAIDFPQSAAENSPAGVRIVVGSFPAAPSAPQPREELGRVASFLTDTSGPVVSLIGPRGVGKTKIAAELARSALNSWNWSLVAWVEGATPDQLVAGIAEIASQLGVSDPAGDLYSSASNLRMTLNSRDADKPGLIIIDNATNPDELGRLIPSIGPVKVLITSTEQAMAGLGIKIDVGPFTRNQSMTYLRERTSLCDDRDAEILASELGDLPVALVQAASSIVLRGYSYRKYIDLLGRVDVGNALKRRAGESYPRGTAEAVLLSIEAVESRAKISSLVSVALERVALLSPSGVDREFLLGILMTHLEVDLEFDTDEAEEVATETLELLTSSSLFTWTESNELAMLSHRLIGRVARDQARARGKLPQAIREVLLHLSVSFTMSDDHWEDRASLDSLTSHILPLWRICCDEYKRRGVEFEYLIAAIQLGVDVLSYLDGTANSSLGLVLGDEIEADALELVGEMHPVTIALSNNLVYARESMGHLQAAVDGYENTLARCYTVLGIEHFNTLITADNLAGAYANVGRFEDAINQHEAVLATRRDLHGAAAPSTLTSACNLAATYYRAGLFPEAVELHILVLNARREVLGSDHQETIISLSSLASARQSNGEHDEAVRLHREAFRLAREALGPDHPITLMTANNVAIFESEADQSTSYKMVRLKEVLEQKRRVLGEEHPETLTTANNLAGLHKELGQLSEAIAQYEFSLATLRAQSSSNPNALLTATNLACAYIDDGQLDRGFDMLNGTIEECRRTLGEAHPDTTSAEDSLTAAYLQAGNVSRAREMLSSELLDRIRVLGTTHISTLVCAQQLAHAYQKMEELDDLVLICERVASDACTYLGPSNKNFLSLANNLAYAYLSVARYDQAAERFSAVCAQRKELLGETAPEVLLLANNLAYCLENLGRIDEAIVLYSDTLEKQETNSSEVGTQALTTADNLAYAFRLNDRLDESVELHERTVRTALDAFGFNSMTLNFINNFALALYEFGDFGRSASAYKTIWLEYERVLGEDDPATVAALSKYQDAIGKAGENS